MTSVNHVYAALLFIAVVVGISRVVETRQDDDVLIESDPFRQDLQGAFASADADYEGSGTNGFGFHDFDLQMCDSTGPVTHLEIVLVLARPLTTAEDAAPVPGLWPAKQPEGLAREWHRAR